MFRSMVLFCLSLFFISSPGAEICKWEDADGLTHYGDCPESNSEVEQIEITPGPSEEDQQQAQERLESLKGKQDQDKEVSKPGKEIVKEEPKQEKKQQYDDKCFGYPADVSEPISPRLLTQLEYKNLSDMFEMLAGYKTWEGVMEEIICYGEEHDPPMGMRQFRVVMKVERDAANLFTMESEGHGIDDMSRGQRDIFWLLLTKDWLRFGNEIGGDHDSPRWDVEIISNGSGSLKFKRYSHATRPSMREIQVWSFQVSRTSLQIKELIYAHHGALVRMKTWTLKR